MEVALAPGSGSLPPDLMLSIRSGSTRRQAPVGHGQVFKFPMAPDPSCPMSVDLYRPLGTKQLIPRVAGGRHTVELGDLRFELDIRPSNEPAAPCKPPSRGDPETTREYIESHRLLQFMQSALQLVIREQPEDPFSFMAGHFAGSAAPAGQPDELQVGLKEPLPLRQPTERADSKDRAAKALREQSAADNAPREQLAAKKAGEEQVAAQKPAKEHAAVKSAEEKAVAEESAEEHATDENVATEKAAAEKAAAEKTAAAENVAAEKAAVAEKAAAEKAAAAAKVAAEQATAEKAAAERAVAEKAADEKALTERVASERAAKEKEAAARAFAEKAQQEAADVKEKEATDRAMAEAAAEAAKQAQNAAAAHAETEAQGGNTGSTRSADRVTSFATPDPMTQSFDQTARTMDQTARTMDQTARTVSDEHTGKDFGDDAVAATAAADIMKAAAKSEAAVGPEVMEAANKKLLRAAEDGDAEQSKAALYEGADPQACEQSMTALMRAAEAGKAQVLELLLCAKAHVDSPDVEGQTAIFYVLAGALAGAPEDIPERCLCLETLVKAGADINRSVEECTPLILAELVTNDDAGALEATLRRLGADGAEVAAASTRAKPPELDRDPSAASGGDTLAMTLEQVFDVGIAAPADLGDSKLGLTLDGVRVAGITGLLEGWNCNNKAQAVQLGDEILFVNGQPYVEASQLEPLPGGTMNLRFSRPRPAGGGAQATS